MYAATISFLFPFLLVAIYHMLSISNHIHDIRLGSPVREPVEDAPRYALDLIDFDAETYFFQPIYDIQDNLTYYLNVAWLALKSIQYKDILNWFCTPIYFLGTFCEEDQIHKIKHTKSQTNKWLKIKRGVNIFFRRLM